MKKFFTFLSAVLMLSACSDSNPSSPESSNKQDEEGVRSFLTVTLVSPKSSTRDDVEDSKYQDGTTSENNVNNIRFYFFYDGGNPAPVFKQAASDTYLSYIDWTPVPADIENGPVQGQTVEKIVKATLGINMPADNQGFPELVLAVINPSADVLAITEELTLKTLTSHIADYYTGLDNNNFVITNSVYANVNPVATINATPIARNNFQPTEDDSEAQPLIIYVERVLARLDFSIIIEDENTITLPGENGSYYKIYKVSTENVNSYEEGTEGTEGTIESSEQNIYVNFLGWNITQTPSKSNLVKNINPGWPANLFGDLEPWNADNYRRSFWAINPPENDFDYIYGSWSNPEKNGDGGNYATALPVPTGNDFVKTYMQENAEPYEDLEDEQLSVPVNPTEVIIAAQLVDEEGIPLTLVRWANRYYTEQGALNAIANVLELYTKTGNTYTKITPSQLKFVTAREFYNNNLPPDVADYYVYVQLNDSDNNENGNGNAQSLTWYNGNTDTSTSYENYQAVNNYIIDRVNYLMVWESGQTYYYFEIKHLGSPDASGYYGVVRNHLYRCILTSIEGLGTPVYDPEQTIIPEKPEGDQGVLSVEIDILQWRVVSNEYNLTWP